MQKELTEEELEQRARSRCIYLLDAIRCAPKKYKQLISMVRRPNSPEWYTATLDRLEAATPETVLELQSIIREEMR